MGSGCRWRLELHTSKIYIFVFLSFVPLPLQTLICWLFILSVDLYRVPFTVYLHPCHTVHVCNASLLPNFIEAAAIPQPYCSPSLQTNTFYLPCWTSSPSVLHLSIMLVFSSSDLHSFVLLQSSNFNLPLTVRPSKKSSARSSGFQFLNMLSLYTSVPFPKPAPTPPSKQSSADTFRFKIPQNPVLLHLLSCPLVQCSPLNCVCEQLHTSLTPSAHTVTAGAHHAHTAVCV